MTLSMQNIPAFTDYDICIVGAGSTGLTLLLALLEAVKNKQLNRILLVDKNQEVKSLPGRSIALNQNTLDFFDRIKFKVADKEVSVLDYLAANLEPIKRILTKTATNGQVVVFDSQAKYEDQFGGDIDLAVLVKQLEQCAHLLIAQLQQQNPQAQIDLLYGCSVDNISLESQEIAPATDNGLATRVSYRKLDLSHPDFGQFSVTANLVCVNNGAKFIKGLVNPEHAQVHLHNQVGIIADVVLNKPINGLAIEYFNAFGPTAFLPTSKNTACVVYCSSPEQAPELAANPAYLGQKLNEVLLDIGSKNLAKATAPTHNVQPSSYQHAPLNQEWHEVQALDAQALQVVKLSPTHSFMLNASLLESLSEPNLVYLGNAAHTVHPVSGQGYNLAVLSVQSFMQAFNQVMGNTPVPASKHAYSPVQGGFVQAAYALANAYNQIHTPIAREVVKRTNTLAQEFSVKGKSSSFVRDFALYHLNAYPFLQDLLINPSLGRKQSNFGLIYRLLDI